MRININKLIIVLLIFILFGYINSSVARSVFGKAAMYLKSPATKDISDQLMASALRSFKIDLWEWLKEEAEVSVDTTNAIQRYHFNVFADSCLERAKIDRKLSGRDFSISISVSGEEVKSILEASNSRYYSISLRFYTLMKSTFEEKDFSKMYNLGILAIYYSLGRMGTPIDMPDESTPRSFLLEDARMVMQNFFNRFKIKTDEYIITGKPGTIVASPIKVFVYLDSTPLSGVSIIGTIPGGKRICQGISNQEGIVELRDIKIPYVIKGSPLVLKPDLSAGIPGVTSFDAKDLGITVSEQTIMFNIIPSTYSLSYKANAANVIKIPKDFSEDSFVRKFFKDSLFLTPATGGQKPDLNFSIINQVSGYGREEFEDTLLKAETEITINDSKGNLLLKRQKVVFEKAYDNSQTIPYGLFFWEVAAKSMRMVKEMLGEL
jgi:hypothetical protein